MDKFIESLTRFSWAMCLFGIRQLANALLPGHSDRPTGGSTAAFDAITSVTEDQLDHPIKLTFRVGDQVQREIVDFIYSALTLEAFTPRFMTRTALDVAQKSAEVFRLLLPGQDSRAAWQEFKNKLETFSLFEHVDSRLNIPSDQNLSLPKLVEGAYLLEPYLAVWATEGLGHYYAERMWEQDGPPTNLLKDAQAGSLSPQSMIALHTGMGCERPSSCRRSPTRTRRRAGR